MYLCKKKRNEIEIMPKALFIAEKSEAMVPFVT